MSNPNKAATLRNVSLAYPAGNTAVDKVSITLFESEIVGLVGANGSGKTTLLKLISGYMPLTGGYIELDQKPIEEFDEKKLNEYVTLVEQNPEGQLSGPTVEDELARNCRMMGLKGEEIREKVTEVLKELNMESAREWFLDEISSGERRRIALGVALLSKPKLLLLDEPLSDLDENGVRATLDFIRSYAKKGVSILVSSHKMDDLIKMTDRLAVLEQGALVQAGPTDVILRNQEMMKKAGVRMPSIAALCLELEEAGLIPKMEKIPTDLEEAKEIIRKVIKT